MTQRHMQTQKHTETILHDQQNQRFTLVFDGQEANLQYRMVNDNTVDFYRTYVPEAFRGQGVAQRLVQAGFDWVEQAGFDMQASCSYVAAKQKSNNHISAI